MREWGTENEAFSLGGRLLFVQPLLGVVVALRCGARNELFSGRGVGTRAATFAQTETIPEQTIGMPLFGRKAQEVGAANGVEREVMPEQVTPTHHTLCQRIAVFGGMPEEMQREGECFGVGVVGEEHTTGVGFETRIGLFETGWEVAHESWEECRVVWGHSGGMCGEVAEIFVFSNKYSDG